MMKSSLIFVFILCASAIYPTVSITRWFSASYEDLRMTLRRYGHCVGDLAPLNDQAFNDTDFLIKQMKVFLEQADLGIEQLANITVLMNTICRLESDYEYPISLHIDVNKYNHSVNGKENRCQSIDEALDSMYYVFKRAAYNKSEPLDFSTIQFYPNASSNDISYNLTDLINTSWIKSDTQIEHICKITGAIKEYVAQQTSNSTAEKRVGGQQSTGVLSSIFSLIDRLFLEPYFGVQRRVYLETTNRLEVVYSGLSQGLGKGYKSTRNRLASLFTGSSNSTTTNVKQRSGSSQQNVTTNSNLLLNNSITNSTTTMAPASSSHQLSSSTSSTSTTTAPSSTAAPPSRVVVNQLNNMASRR